MAILENVASGARLELSAEVLVGRAGSCAVVLEHPLASALHARLRWNGRSWSLRDLSRNGTWINRKPAERERWTALARGDELWFGHPEACWRLVTADPPRLSIVPCDGGEPIVLTDGPVALPSEERPEATLWVDRDGFIVLESAEGRRALADNQVFSVEGRAYRLQAPFATPPTAEAAPRASDAQLELRVSRHEEHIEARLIAAGRTYPLRPRAHFPLLLTLARERLADERASLAPTEQGWLSIDELCRSLQADRATINTHVYRLRKQLSDCELSGAIEIVERRFDSDEIRVGCASVEIVSA